MGRLHPEIWIDQLDVLRWLGKCQGDSDCSLSAFSSCGRDVKEQDKPGIQLDW